MKSLTYAIAIGSALCFNQYADHHEKERTTQAGERDRQVLTQQERTLTQQERNQQSVFKPSEISEQQLKKSVTDVNKASSFMRMEVRNLENEKLGSIQDIVFDPEQGRIGYVVLSTGGFLGIADKHVAVPLNSLEAKPGENFLVLNMSKEQLQSAPGLAQGNWPSLDTFATGGAAAGETGAGAQQHKAKSDSDASISGSAEIKTDSDKPQGAPATSQTETKSLEETQQEPESAQPESEQKPE